ncbi:hypothetical protein PM082_003513 [Marasmius tenuissimus]|nr:hypothetical protein PM082_003513 [Marasmius tenuissimus]
MSLRAIFYAFVFGGISATAAIIGLLFWYTWTTAIPVEELQEKKALETLSESTDDSPKQPPIPLDVNDPPKTRKGWLIVRRTFEESTLEGGYVNLMRSFLDARSKDPKRSRPKDTWFVVLKGKILYLYEDEGMTECEAVIQLGSHDVVIYPENLLDGELYTRRNAICLKPKKKSQKEETAMPSLSKEMKLGDTEAEATANVEKTAPLDPTLNSRKREQEKERRIEAEKGRITAAREEALEPSTPWYIFVRSPYEMEDWYLAMIHASDNSPQTPLLKPLQSVFLPSDMNILVSKLDEQPDVIPMRWFNALLGRIIFSFYRTQHLESFIIGRLMKKISKVKRPAFLPSVVVTEVSVGNRTPLFSKPMLKELTKEGDASMEVHLQYKGEIRITIEATVNITTPLTKGPYIVKIALAAILKEIEGNMLIKIKRPPSNRIWYAFTQMPKIVLEVEPIVSDRQITWGMILSTIESKIKEIIQESVVLPNMDDISFFESGEYSHRGGIWADAARRTETTVQADPQSEPPVVPSSTGDTVETSEDFVPPTISKTPTVASTASEPVPLSTPSLSSSPEDSSASNYNNRRKTWFGSMRGLDSNSLKDLQESTGEEQERGTTTETDESTVPPRPHSAPQKAELMPGEVPGKEPRDEIDSGEGLPAEPSSRRASTRVEGFDISTPTPNEPSTSPNPLRERTLSASPLPNTPTSPSSFLSALKSKTADKQALSNSAKEAMKKWGVNVNWGNLRKDTASSSNDDLADHDSISGGLSRTRTASSSGSANSTIAQKARASYAEVRAAVAERRGRQLPSNGSPDDEGHLSAGSGRTSSHSPSPGPSNRNHGELESSPNLLATPPARKTSSASASSAHGYMDTSDLDRDQPNAQAVPMSRAPTQNSQYGGMGKGSPPIYSVQPQSKTMSIPGIHASHRGEVMSMGNVAPSPPPSQQPQRSSDEPTSSPEAKSKVLSSLGGSAGIQSVYRLFSKPQQGQGSQRGEEGAEIHDRPMPAGALNAQPRGQEQDTQCDLENSIPSSAAALALDDTNASPSTPPRKRTPPPIPPRHPKPIVGTVPPSISPVSRSPAPALPPRAPLANRKSSEMSAPTVSVSPESSNTSGVTIPSPTSTSDEQPSAASEKLKSIAKRASLTGPKDKDKDKDREGALSSSTSESVGVTA